MRPHYEGNNHPFIAFGPLFWLHVHIGKSPKCLTSGLGVKDSEIELETRPTDAMVAAAVLRCWASAGSAAPTPLSTDSTHVLLKNVELEIYYIYIYIHREREREK